MNELLQLLALGHGSQTATSLRDELRRQGLRLEEFEILRELRKLQTQGIVRADGTRWRLLKLPPNFKPPVPQEKSHSPKSGRIGTETTTAKTSAHRSQSALPAPAKPNGRWELFRALCRYYMDCLLQDEAPQLRSYVENEDDTWISVQQVPWGRIATGTGFAVSLGRDQSLFERNRARRGEDQCVYLCYPLKLVKAKEGNGFVVPLFVQPMKTEWRRGVMHLDPDGPVGVNGAWLEYAFRRRDERTAFLRAMGFLSDVEEDEDSGEPQTLSSTDFAQVAQSAALYVHDAETFAQDIEPMNLSNVADWAAAQPGLYNVAILTLGPRLRYTASLMRDLREISAVFSDEELDGTALASMFPHEAPPPEPPPTLEKAPDSSKVETVTLPSDGLAQTRLLHQAQRDAIVNAMGESLSVITGPPGTGKSEVVAAILLNQLMRGRPSLFASKNHQALEAVIPRLNSAVEGSDLIIQTASRDLAQRQNYLEKLKALLARPPRPDAAEGETHQKRFAQLFDAQQLALSDLCSIENARMQYEELYGQLESVRSKLPLLLQADDAIAHWPEGMSRSRLDALRGEMEQVLSPPTNLFQKIWRVLRRRQIAARRRALHVALQPLPSPYPGQSLPGVDAPFEVWAEYFIVWEILEKAALLRTQVRGLEQRIGQIPRVDDCNQRLARIQRDIEQNTQRWMRWAAGGIPNAIGREERESLDNLRAGIQNWGARRFARELRNNFPLIMRAFPLWSASNLSVRSALPLVPGLFDLVIIDEASQCDIPSIVPLLARAKRAVLVGDPMQLQYVCSLDAAIDQTLQELHGLTGPQMQRFTYRVNSAFGLADANASVPDTARVRLNLHFRSHDIIADYCNEAFYNKTLHVVTMTESLKIPRGVRPGIHWTDITGTLKEGTTGVWSAGEIEAVQVELSKLVASGYRGTIGVVTPFRQQMIRLKDAIETSDVLPNDFKERVRFLVATAHGFQGDERDLILFSLCGGQGMPSGGAIFLRENPNLFNVAVSRARAVLHVIGDHKWAQGCGISFIEKLAARASRSDQRIEPTNSEPYQSPWEKVLADALQAAGISVVPQYPIAGRFLDLGILKPRKIDVEVDGESVHRTAGGGRKDDDHWRDLQLKSLGWEVCRFWVYELRENLPKCVDRIIALLERG